MDDLDDEQGSLIQVSENGNWDHYQRMFPFQSGRPGRILRVQASTELNPQSEVRLRGAAERKVYDQLVCGLFWHRDQRVGSAFPLTQTYRQKAMWMTCQHVAAGDRKLTLSTGHDQKYVKDAVRHQVTFKPNLHINLEADQLPYPADPSQSIRLRDHGDIRAFEIDKYSSLGRLDEYKTFFIPCGDLLGEGSYVTCLGYPGRLSIDECRRTLATEQDYDNYLQDCDLKGEKPVPASAFLLDQNVAYQRKVSVDDQSDGVFFSDVLNAAPGEVVAASDHLVQYRCSTLPQMSGGPCVMLDEPFKLVAMHVHGGGQLDRNYNFGVSVKHIEFVRAYLVMVLPHLQKKIKSIYDVSPKAIDTLRSYLEIVGPSIDKLQMQPIVDNFWSAVQEYEEANRAAVSDDMDK